MLRKILVSAVSALIVFFTAHQSQAQEQEQPQASGERPAQSSHPVRNQGSMFPEDVPGLEEIARTALEEGNGLRYLQAMILLRRQRPYEPEYLYGMVVAYAMLGRSSGAYNYMLEMQQQGLSYDLNASEQTQSIRGSEVYDYLNDLMIKAGEPVGEGEVAFTLAENISMPEAIAWDEGRQSFLVGTLRDGAVIAVDIDGKAKELIRANDENGLWGIRDLLVDNDHGRLWVSSAAVPEFSGFDPSDEGKGAVFEFKLETLELINRYPVPEDGNPHEPGSMALAPGGGIYLADRATPVIFSKTADGDGLAPFLGNTEMVGLRDMVLSSDAGKLYVADIAKGILVVDLENRSSAMLAGPKTLNLGGLSGLVFWQGYLVIVQKDISPERLLRLELDSTGSKVETVRPLAIALQPFDHPGSGTIMGDYIYYFANPRPQSPDKESAPVIVMRTPLDSGNDIVPPDMRKFEEETMSKVRDK
jgi:hypothetical protein